MIYVKEPVEYIVSNSICAGDSILFDNVYIMESGSYSKTVGACDSTVILELNVIEAVSESIQRSFCEGDSVIIENEVFKDEGVFQVSTLSAMGCDSLIDLTIVHHLPSTKDSIVIFCNGDSILIDGIWYSEDSMVSVNGMNSLGCDSTTIFNIELVDVLSDQDTLSICAGDSLILHGQWQSSAGDYSEMFIAESGCDSVFTYHLIVQDTAVLDIEEMICEGDTIFINGELFTEDTLYSFTVPSTSFCDSTINYTITLEEMTVDIIEHSICEGDSLFISDRYYFDEVMVVDTLPGVLCDTIINYHLSVLSSDLTLHDSIFSDELPIIINGEEFVEIGNYEQILTNKSGCDSVVVINIVANEEDIIYPNIFSPNSDNINDEWTIDLTDYLVNELIIFDRWGNKVASWVNETNISWYGELNGDTLEQGVYVFILKYTDDVSKRILTGNITLLR